MDTHFPLSAWRESWTPTFHYPLGGGEIVDALYLIVDQFGNPYDRWIYKNWVSIPLVILGIASPVHRDAINLLGASGFLENGCPGFQDFRDFRDFQFMGVQDLIFPGFPENGCPGFQDSRILAMGVQGFLPGFPGFFIGFGVGLGQDKVLMLLYLY